MSHDQVTQLVAVCAGLLSLWVLGAFVGVGVLVGAGVIYYWPRLF
jgi:hypothetical protein